MTAVQILPCGDRALLVQVTSLAEAMSMAQALRVARRCGQLPEVVDLVPAARTVLVRTGPGADLSRVRDQVAALGPDPAGAKDRPGHRGLPGDPDLAGTTEPALRIPVSYDGPDLLEVARLTGLSVPELVRAHTGTEWTCAFTGFSPGFGYLAGGDPRLVVPRRPEPRTIVAAGSVGLAGEFSGIYPSPAPGGWQLIGHTDTVLWDLDRDPPALLTPGRRVRFVARDSSGAAR